MDCPIVIDDISTFLAPGKLRQDLLEWVVQKFDPTILEKGSVSGALRQMGLNFDNETVTGLCGQPESFNCLSKVVSLVFHSTLLPSDSNLLMKAQAPLISQIAGNASALFNPPTRLFPPGFPKIDDQEPDLEHLESLVFDIQEKIVHVRERVEVLTEVDSYKVREGNETLAEKEDITQAGNSLKTLRDTVNNFNLLFELSLKGDLRRLQQTEANSIGTLASKSLEQKQILQKSAHTLHQLQESIGRISVELQLATSEAKAAFKDLADVKWLEEEGLIRAVSEFKSLRLSAAYIARAQRASK